MSFLGFENEKEFLVGFDKFVSVESKRKLFLEFFNNQVESKLRFSKIEINRLCGFPFCDIFKIKISILLNVGFVRVGTIFSPKLNSKQKINFFTPNAQEFLNKCKYVCTTSLQSRQKQAVAIKLLNLIGGTKLTYLVDAQNSFEKFILNKLLKDQKTRFIEQENNHTINIIPAKENNLKIFVYWQLLEKNKLLINEHICEAINCIKDTVFKNIYLAYIPDVLGLKSIFK